VAILNAGGVRY